MANALSRGPGDMRAGLLLLGSCVLAACAPTSPAAAPPPAEPEPKVVVEPVPEPASAPAPVAEAEPEVSEPAPEASQQAAKVERVNEECAALCDNADAKCSRRSARKCRANCDRYLSLADTCEAQVLGAIRCQASTPNLVCSNVVGECTREFRELNACESGQTVAGGEAPASINPPEGWQRIADSEAGFSVHMPAGAKVGDEKGHRTWSVESNGVTYLAAVLPPIEGVTEKDLTAVTIRYLGLDCQAGIRLHGRYEKDGAVAERFDSSCRNGDAWHGMLRASSKNLVITAERVPSGKQATGDRFYYSFEYLK